MRVPSVDDVSQSVQGCRLVLVICNHMSSLAILAGSLPVLLQAAQAVGRTHGIAGRICGHHLVFALHQLPLSPLFI